MGALEDFYNNPDVLNAIVGNQQYATGQKPSVAPSYMGPQIPQQNGRNAPDADTIINALKGVGHTGQDIFNTMQRAVTEGPYSSPTGEYDPKIGMLAPQMMLPGMGRALGAGSHTAELGALGSAANKVSWTPSMQQNLLTLLNKHGTTSEAFKQEFKSMYPGYTGTDKAIEIAANKVKNLGGANIQGGASSSVGDATNPTRQSFDPVQNHLNNPATEKMIWDSWHIGDSPTVIAQNVKRTMGLPAKHPSITTSDVKSKMNELFSSGKFGSGGSTELGAFGGRGKLNTPSYGGDINYLQSNSPVNKEWIKNWAEQAGVNLEQYNASKGSSRPTRYFKLEDPANPGNVATVRMPSDVGRHHGYPQAPSKSGNYFDAGLGNINSERPLSEHTLINQSGQSYANPEALSEALALKLSKSAPMGEFKLVSPDYAPIKPEVKLPTPERIRKDPNQLKLLSSGIPLHPFFGQEADTQKEPYVDMARERIDTQDLNRSIEHYERYRKGKPPVPEVQPPKRGNMISTMDILNILRQQSGQTR